MGISALFGIIAACWQPDYDKVKALYWVQLTLEVGWFVAENYGTRLEHQQVQTQALKAKAACKEWSSDFMEDQKNDVGNIQNDAGMGFENSVLKATLKTKLDTTCGNVAVYASTITSVSKDRWTVSTAACISYMLSYVLGFAANTLEDKDDTWAQVLLTLASFLELGGAFLTWIISRLESTPLCATL